MYTDRSNANNNGRPLKPTLATTRTAKTPVAPRLAPSLASAGSAQNGRPARTTISTPKGNSASQDDRTPLRPVLNSNVTPRSSARKSRVGLSSPGSTPSVTPSATPSSTRPPSTIEVPVKEQGPGLGGFGINGSQSAPGSNRPRSINGGIQYIATPTPRPPLGNIYSNTAVADAGVSRAKSPKFFHANDARPVEVTPVPKKGPVFFYANGEQDTDANQELPSPPLSAAGRAPYESRFFHADSLPEPRGSSPVLTPSSVSASLEPWTNGNQQHKSPSLRPPSPPKDNIHLSYRKGASQVIRPNLHTRTSALSLLSGHSQGQESDYSASRRRSSATSSAVRLGHGKSASLSSIDSVTPRKTPLNELSTIGPSPLHNQDRAVSVGSVPESPASAPGPTTETLSGLPTPSPQSPVRSGQGTYEHMNDLAANARRERKVLDLEISNSSLLAINRQLEKEVRKQKAELRMFRRMSRAGRFSTDTAGSFPETFSAIGARDLGDLSDMSEEQGDAEDEPEYSSESSFDEGTISPTVLAERDAAYLLRDEKRLQLDLTKHRELLIDSQKMNQSLKRCLDWTELLIKDGRKALAYQVRVSDVQLGGRVLSTEENPDMEEEGVSKALLSPWSPAHGITELLDQASLAGSQTADSDHDVDVNGHEPAMLETHSNINVLGSPLQDTTSCSLPS
ncbi:uncharacterized protein EI97DRAFT_423963 [Westerdykella ornata]|uniref:Uncharacterized protein n=1 Tax=Westerdykella ornata TaxID=318751 RepID=A0A6A6JC23_WESOR|nr:uncharacterized protein EI97DRAFT_423963 [Westerdykella ornata]KAF2273723.1 hypothetical protein EI97DRAFT_423963 [Westerdykella ornata]